MNLKDNELEFLAAWATRAGEFLEDHDPHRMTGAFTGPIEVCVRESDLRSMREFKHVLSQSALGLRKEPYAELDEILKREFGLGLRGRLPAEEMALAAVIHRGRISDEDEYRLLEERAEAIWDDAGKAEELERINGLLAAYQA